MRQSNILGTTAGLAGMHPLCPSFRTCDMSPAVWYVPVSTTRNQARSRGSSLWHSGSQPQPHNGITKEDPYTLAPPWCSYTGISAGGIRAIALLKISHVISMCNQNRESLDEVLDLKMTSIPLYLSNSESSMNRMKFLGEMLSFYIKQQSWMSHVHALKQIHAICVLSQLFEALEGEMDLRRKGAKMTFLDGRASFYYSS